jgi:hypothetical protein
VSRFETWEIWGITSRNDPLDDYFKCCFKGNNFMDIESFDTKTNLRHNKPRREVITKRLDRVIVLGNILAYFFQIPDMDRRGRLMIISTHLPPYRK